MMTPMEVFELAALAVLFIWLAALRRKLVHVEGVVNANAESSLILEAEVDDLIVGFEALTGRDLQRVATKMPREAGKTDPEATTEIPTGVPDQVRDSRGEDVSLELDPSLGEADAGDPLIAPKARK